MRLSTHLHLTLDDTNPFKVREGGREGGRGGEERGGEGGKIGERVEKFLRVLFCYFQMCRRVCHQGRECRANDGRAWYGVWFVG